MEENKVGALAQVINRIAGPSRSLHVVILGLGLFFIAIPLLWVADKISIYYLSRTYVDEVAYVFNIGQHFAKAVSIFVFMLVTFLFGKLGFSKTERLVGIGGLATLLIAHSILLGFGTKNQFFDRTGKAIKCYVIARDGDVRYLEHIGIDPQTGRQCREATPEIVERLQEYQKGKRPSRLADDAKIDFYEGRTGEPIVWFWRTKSGEIELFNLMGFHPENGSELLPVTPEIVELYKEQAAQRAAKREEAESRKRPPQRIDPENYEFFNPRTGNAQVWYWRDGNGDFEFFDNRGFHPQTGEDLKRIDASVIKAWLQRKSDKETREIQGRQREETEARVRAEQATAQAEEERRAQEARDERARREAQAGATCDQLAANPSDLRKSTETAGVRYEELKGHVREAIEACRVAIETFPNELRYRYQYARALGVDEPDKAVPFYQQLIKQHYPAAYDNLGNIFLRKRDMRSAINVLKAGVKVEDPDSMVTLADLIVREYVPVTNPTGAKYALLERAARLGHSGAQSAVERLKIEQQELQQRAFQQQQEQQMMLDVFGTILKGIVH